MISIAMPTHQDSFDLAFTASRLNGGKVTVSASEKGVMVIFSSDRAAHWFKKVDDLLYV